METKKIVKQVQDIVKLGDFPRLIAFVNAQRMETQNNPEIGFAYFRAFFLQGDFKKAESILEALNHPSHKLPYPELVLLKLKLARVRLYQGKNLSQCLLTSQRVISKTKETELTPVELARVRYEYIGTQLAGVIYGEVKSNRLPDLVNDLDQIALVFAQNGLLDKSLNAKLLSIQQGQWGDRFVRLGALAQRAYRSKRKSFSGHVLLEQARLARKEGHSIDEIKDILANAQAFYHEEKHRYGLIDLDLELAILNHDRLSQPPWDAFEDCLKRFEHTQYFRGQSQAILEYSQRALQTGKIVLSNELRDRHNELSERVGLGLARAGAVLAHADSLMRLGQFGEAIETCLAELGRKPSLIHQASIKILLSSCYSFLGDYPRAASITGDAENIFINLGKPDAASEIALKHASDLISTREPGAFDLADQKLLAWLERDKKARFKQAAEKLILLAQLRFSRYAFLEDKKQAHLNEAKCYLSEVEKLANKLTHLLKHQISGKLFQMRALIANTENDERLNLNYLARARESFSRAGMEFERANMSYMLGCVWLNYANKNLLPAFEHSIRFFNEALEYYQKVGMREQLANTRFMLAKLFRNAIPWVDEKKSELVSQAMNQLHLAESDLDSIRRGAYAGETILAVQSGKQGLVQKSHRVYQLALEILCFVNPDPEATWHWVQRAKARALADILGNHATIPATWIHKLSEFPGARESLVREQDLVACINMPNHIEKLKLREELNSLRQKMAEDPQLKEYLELREGKAIRLNDLGNLSEMRLNFPLFVDWFSVMGWLFIATVRVGERPRIEPLNLKLSKVEDFFHNHLDGPNMFRMTLRECPHVLDQLNFLIEPLKNLSKPEEILVLCPTGILARLPLHALKLQGKALIERQPVVYTPSLSVTRHCIQHQGRSMPVSAALFGDPNGDRPAAAELVSKLSTRLKQSALKGSEVTRKAFLENSKSASYIHFQGHALHLPEDPLGSYLRCADGRLRAKDIFTELKIQAELVTLAACESAANVIRTGDEPLGLIPAFLYAGARTVLATQWPVTDEVTASAMEYFYHGLLENTSQSKAQLLRKTILKLKSISDYSKPYYWAPFTLHGDWL